MAVDEVQEDDKYDKTGRMYLSGKRNVLDLGVRIDKREKGIIRVIRGRKVDLHTSGTSALV